MPSSVMERERSMRHLRVFLASLFVGVTLFGVSASGAIHNSPPVRVASLAPSPAHESFANPSAGSAMAPRVVSTGERTLISNQHPAPPRPNAAEDLWLMLLVAVILVGHQMRRKHRVLRVRPFGL